MSYLLNKFVGRVYDSDLHATIKTTEHIWLAKILGY